MDLIYGNAVVIDGGEVLLSSQIDGGEIGDSFVPLPHITIGEVETLPSDAEATATMTGTASQPVLNLGLVRGEKGDSGAVISVNGKDGNVVLDAEDVGALPADTRIPEKTSELQNDSGFITGIDSSDVTEALGYTPYDASNPAGYLNEVTSQDVTEALGFTPYNATNPNGYVNQTQAANAAPVQNVNGKTGNVSLDASDVGALPDDTTYVTSFNGQTGPVTYQAPVQSVNGQTGNVQLQIPTVPTDVSAFTNDAGYLTSEDVGSVFTVKGSVYQYSDLPTTGNTIGDVYYVEEDETISGTLYPGQVGYIWITVNNVDRWEELGQTIDTSEFQPAINVSGVLQGDGNGGISSRPVDTSPSNGSSNLITSGAVYAAIIGAIERSY